MMQIMLSTMIMYAFFNCYTTSSHFGNPKKMKNENTKSDNTTRILDQETDNTEFCDGILNLSQPSIKNFTYPIFTRKAKSQKTRFLGNTLAEPLPSTSNFENNSISEISLHDLQLSLTDNPFINKEKTTHSQSRPAVIDTVSPNFFPFSSDPQTHSYGSQQQTIQQTEQTMETISDSIGIQSPDQQQTYNTLDTKTTCPINVIFFHTTVNLLKNILYYRFNIAKFFIVLNKIDNKDKKKHLSNNTTILEFIKLAIEFSKKYEGNLGYDEQIVDEVRLKELKGYERWLLSECKTYSDFTNLNKSKEFTAIKRHNKHYTIALSAEIRKSAFDKFYIYLSQFFLNVSASKYFPMLSSVLKSLYDIDSIINEKIDQSLQNDFLDLGVFTVEMCSCSKRTKQHFVFHFAICGIIFFSVRHDLPTSSMNKYDSYCVINSYPKEFFIQFILLVHLIINCKNEKITLKDLNHSFILQLKSSIHDLLFVNVDNAMQNLFQKTLQDMLKQISEFFNYKIYESNAVPVTRVIQTLKENFDLSNKLIPTIRNFTEIIFKLAKTAYRQVKMSSNEEVQAI